MTQAGNVTSVDAHMIFNSVANTLGFDPLILFVGSSIFIVIGLSFMRLPKDFIIFGLVAYFIFGTFIGIAPFWISIFGVSLFMIFAFTKLNGFISKDDETPIYHYPMFVTHEESKIEIPKTTNCKNCGGPNVNKITCEWCGQVLE